MDFMTIKEAAKLWNITPRRVQVLCAEGRIEGAFKHGSIWFIPNTAHKPVEMKRGPKGDNN